MRQWIFAIAIFFLIILIGLSLFAFFIAIDTSTNANNQIPEFALMHPGSEVKVFVPQDKNHEIELLSYLWFGSGPRAKYFYQPPDENKTFIQSKITFWFGTDKYGRDVMSRILLGIRYTLLIGLLSVLASLLIGIFMGSLSAYYGGLVDKIISMLISIFWSLPTILLSFAVLLALGRSMISIFLAIGLTMWSDVARLVRGQVMALKELPFIQAAKSLGFSNFRIIFKHILPNIANPIWVSVATNFALAVLLESGLSFLGLGLTPPTPTLGNILQEQYSYAVSGKPFLAIIPAIVVVLLILSFQIITNYVRDRTDVKMISR